MTNSRTEAVKSQINGGSRAVANVGKPTTIHGFLETYKGEIARALPKHMTADRMARIALTECRKTPALMKCKPESLFGAVIQAAQIGLEPGGALGHCYLIPFGQEVNFIVGYRGMIDLARRSGQIVSLEAHAVYEGDTFECSFGLHSDLKHEPDWQNSNRTNPDRLRFVYAVAKLKDGGVQFEVMARAEIDAIRSRSKAARSGPWVSDYVAMALKTVIRRLFKYLPVSIELSNAVAMDERAEADQTQDNGFVIEGIAEQSPDIPDQDDEDLRTVETASTTNAGPTFASVAESLNRAKDIEVLDVAADLISAVPEDQQDELREIYARRRDELSQ